MKKARQGTERWALQKVYAGLLATGDTELHSRFYRAGDALRQVKDHNAKLKMYSLPINGGMIANCDLDIEGDNPIGLEALDASPYSDVTVLDMSDILEGLRAESFFRSPKLYSDLMDDLLLSLRRNDEGDLGMDPRLHPGPVNKLLDAGHIEETSKGRFRVTEEGASAYLKYTSLKAAAGASETYADVQRRIDFMIEDETPRGPAQNWSFDTIPMFIPEVDQMSLVDRMDEIDAKIEATFQQSPQMTM